MSWISFIIDPKVRHRDQKPSKTETRRDPLSANYETVHCSGWRVSVSKGVLTSLSVIVTISPRQVVPGRMSLLVILLLVLVNVFNSVRSNAPSSGLSKLNAIDTFIMTCIFMVFSTILEYAIVLSILAFELDKVVLNNFDIDINQHSQFLEKATTRTFPL